MEPILDECETSRPFDQARLQLLSGKANWVKGNEQTPAAFALSQHQTQPYKQNPTLLSFLEDDNEVSPTPLSPFDFDSAMFADEDVPRNQGSVSQQTHGLEESSLNGKLTESEDFDQLVPSLPSFAKKGTRIVSSGVLMPASKPATTKAAHNSLTPLSPPRASPSFPQKRRWDSDADADLETSSFVSLSSTKSSVSSIRATDETTLVQTFSAPLSLVHQACQLYPRTETIVDSAMRVDPGGVKRRLSTCDAEKRRKYAYDFPINIALNNNASHPVIELLAYAAPEVLVNTDGPGSACALSCALLHKRKLDVVSVLLEANPDQVRVADRNKNFPLHAACANGASLDAVKLLASAYPSALHKKNFNRQTPLDIAQQRSCCSDDVIDYLQCTSFGELEENAVHLDDILWK